MAKLLRREPLYIAPQIKGHINRKGQAIVRDERNNNLRLNPLQIDDKIIIFERQVKEWFLNRASKLLRGKNTGFVILMIALSYIEGIEQYRRGQSSVGQSGEFFRASMRRIFLPQANDNILTDFYHQARCGLFHNGMVGGKVIIKRSYDNPIDFFERDTIKINPKKFLQVIRLDFNKYIKELKNIDNTESRSHFDIMFFNV